METEYVRKDVFDAEIRRLDEKIDNTLARIEARMDAHMAQIDKMFAEMNERLNTMDTQLDGLIRKIYWVLTVVGLAFAGVSIYLALPH